MVMSGLPVAVTAVTAKVNTGGWTHSSICNIKSDAGVFPIELAFTPDGNKLYTTNHWENSVLVRHLDLHYLITGIDGYAERGPRGLALSPDGTVAHVANQETSSISVIDTGSRIVVGKIASERAGRSYGEIVAYGDQRLTVSDLEEPYGIRVQVDPVGGAPARIRQCGSTVALPWPVGMDSDITCTSTTITVNPGRADLEFETEAGEIAVAQVAGGNTLTVKAPDFPFDPPLTLAAPDTNANPIPVTIDAHVKKEVHAGHDVTIADDVMIDKGGHFADGVSFGAGTSIDKEVTIGEYTLVGEDCRIEKEVTIGANAYIGDGVTLSKGRVVADGEIILE